jgi:hypothetical protein
MGAFISKLKNEANGCHLENKFRINAVGGNPGEISRRRNMAAQVVVVDAFGLSCK